MKKRTKDNKLIHVEKLHKKDITAEYKILYCEP